MNLSRNARALVLSTFVLSGSLASPAGGQITLRGVAVSSADGAGVGNVLVVLDSGPRARTDTSGAFTISGVPAGPHRIALVAPGCQITIASFVASSGGVREITFPMAYDPRVVAEARRRAAQGRVIGAAEIERMHVHDLFEVLSRAFPGIVGALPTQPGQDARLRSRGSVSLQGEVEPAIEVDGARMGVSGVSRLVDIRLEDVAWIQVMRGASGGWDVGTGGAGGLIRIQTKRGAVSGAPFVDPERCAIPELGV